jgi:hypothetical protein
MRVRKATPLKIIVDGAGSVSALLNVAANPRACFVFAHGAGAGMTHGFMNVVATSLAERGVSTLRYQFPYIEKGNKRPDRPSIAHMTVRAAVEEAARLCPGKLIAGGKSFGGRMTSQAQSEAPLLGVCGLAFFGFPLHPAGKPSIDRADHLSRIQIPMLFLQGTRDKLAEPELLRQVTDQLRTKASVHLVEHADHSFHVPVRSGRSDAKVLNELLDAFAIWAATVHGNS